MEEPVHAEAAAEEAAAEEPFHEEEPVNVEEAVEEAVVEEPRHVEAVAEEAVVEEPLHVEVVAEEVVAEEAVVEPVQVDKVIPKIVFIIPYRDRLDHQVFFSNHMNSILEDYAKTDYEIYYAHQCDTREFNRGAMKNIGFLTIKEKYPNDYQNITFVFNDVDIMPRTKGIFDYETTLGYIKHFYGYTFTLGGVVSIKGADFEKVGGFPNFWAWGYEDNLLQLRALSAGLILDRRQFYPILDGNVIHLNEGMNRLINKNEFDKYVGNTNEGWHSIQNISKLIDETTGFINIAGFNTGSDPVSNQNIVYDLRNGSKPFAPTPLFKTSRRRSSMGMRL